MRIVFMGTPQFAVASLDALREAGIDVAAVVTSPDKPAGRGRKIQESEVKQYAIKHGLPVFQPEKLKDIGFLKQLHELKAELFVVVAFRMLPEEVWKMPSLGTINLHASLLPDYRGAAPINWAIINGEECTGTTVFFINQDIDTGNILSYNELEITDDDNAGTMHDKLMYSGATHLVKAVQNIAGGNFTTIPQKGSSIKIAPKIFRETCKINCNQNVTQIHNLIRGLSPYPAAWTTITTPRGEHFTLKIFDTNILPDTQCPAPGVIRSDNRTFLQIAAREGWLVIKDLQLEGKKRMDIQDFLRGMPNICNYRIEMN